MTGVRPHRPLQQPNFTAVRRGLASHGNAFVPSWSYEPVAVLLLVPVQCWSSAAEL